MSRMPQRDPDQMGHLLEIISELIWRLSQPDLSHAGVIPWSSPVPSFGDISTATVATLGINPSNREFVDSSGAELAPSLQRLHTLKSLGLKSWADAEVRHKTAILDHCLNYFARNPYDLWFKGLEYLMYDIGCSYYSSIRIAPAISACHLDLIPYATIQKWTSLSNFQRSLLLRNAGSILGQLLKNAPVRLLILNGASVTQNLEKLCRVQFTQELMAAWTLPRRLKPGVIGTAYSGTITEVAGVSIGRPVHILGFNHNIQSSFGVTATARDAIKQWLGRCANEILK